MPRTETDFDVVVAGGGAGGVGAAIGAARAGARVALVEKYGFLGGAATNAQVLAYCGFFHHGGDTAVRAVEGAGEAVLAQMRKQGVDCQAYHSPTTGNWIVLLDPERLKLALDRVLAEHGVEVLLHSRVAAASRTADAIESVTVAGMDGRFRLIAESFVDASGDANLALVAGQPMRIGDGEGRLQAFTMPIRIGGLTVEGRVDRQRLIAAVDTFNERSPYKITRSDGGIYTRVAGSTDFWWLIIDREMPDLSSKSFTAAERSGREMANLMVEVLQEKVPGFETAWLAQTGPQIGVRETRHPAARYSITHDDVLNGRLREDGVARASWPIELHSEAGKPIYEHIGGEGYYHIPLDALHAAGLSNLWYAGRVIGADPRAYGSTRGMGTAFASGEAAGVAAALTARQGKPPAPQAVREQLLAQGALI